MLTGTIQNSVRRVASEDLKLTWLDVLIPCRAKIAGSLLRTMLSDLVFYIAARQHKGLRGLHRVDGPDPLVMSLQSVLSVNTVYSSPRHWFRVGSSSFTKAGKVYAGGAAMLLLAKHLPDVPQFGQVIVVRASRVPFTAKLFGSLIFPELDIARPPIEPFAPPLFSMSPTAKASPAMVICGDRRGSPRRRTPCPG